MASNKKPLLKNDQNLDFFLYTTEKDKELNNTRNDEINKSQLSSHSSNIKADDLYYHNISFALLYFISIFIVFISCAYYYSFNNFNNRIFLPEKKMLITEKDNIPFYKIISKYTKGNMIYIDLELENFQKTQEISMISNILVTFEFFSDSVHLKIFSPETKSNLNESAFYKLNDIDYSSKKLNNYKESNIAIIIDDYPFNFILSRKDDGAIIYDSFCDNKHLLYYSKNYIRICNSISDDNFFFGLGDDTVNHGINLLVGRGQKFNLFSNISDSFPFILSYNKYNMTSSGILLLNSGPIRTAISTQQMIIQLITGDINMYIFAGITVKQTIMQIQNNLGLPMIPYYFNIDWNFLEKTKIVNVNNEINLDLFNGNNTEVTLNNFFNYADEISSSEKMCSIFIDSKIYGKELENLNLINYLFLSKGNSIYKNDFMLNYLNTIGLQESKFYYSLYPSQSRKIIFSTRAFIGSSIYSIKLIKDIPFNYEGIRIVINKLKVQSLFGNPYCYIEFDQETLEENSTNNELVLRWGQLLSILPITTKYNLNIPLYNINFRYIFSIYIYNYFVVISTEGGTYFRPLFYDLKSNIMNEDLISTRYQLMLGSNIMISPIFFENVTNITCIFPEDKFYDFYTGEYINKNGDGHYQFSYEKNKLPLFLRGGKVTPVQLMDESEEFLETNENLSMDLMKTKPIQMLIALDSNFQASGRLLIDDLVSTDSRKKKTFYKMLITVTQRTSDMSIFFRVYSYKYNLPKNLFANCINRIVIYGFNKMAIRKVTIMNKNGRTEIDKSNLIFSQMSDILTIPNISVPLNVDTKILIL